MSGQEATRRGVGRPALAEEDRRVFTTVRLAPETMRALQAQKGPRDSLGSVIDRLIAVAVRGDAADMDRTESVRRFEAARGIAEDKTQPRHRRISAVRDARNYAGDSRLRSPVVEAGDWVRRLEDMDNLYQELREQA